MNDLIVVDVGNSRIKWGRCDLKQVREIASLPADDPQAWEAQWQAWTLSPETSWVVSGVHPARRDSLAGWLRQRRPREDCTIQVLSSYRQLPIAVGVEAPEKVGIDRLLNAVAANRRRQANSAAVLVDAGTAVTVDYVDAGGVFRGGAIFPGIRLMAQALNDHTAALPTVAVVEAVPPPGTSTNAAIQTGVYHAVLGGIERLIAEYQSRFAVAIEVYLTGGDAALLSGGMRQTAQVWPEMTLEGILHSKPD